MFCFLTYRGGFLCCQAIIYWPYWPSCRRIMHWHINSSSCRTVMQIQKQCHLSMIRRITSSQISKKATERLYWSLRENLTRVIHVTGNSRWVFLLTISFWLKCLLRSTDVTVAHYTFHPLFNLSYSTPTIHNAGIPCLSVNAGCFCTETLEFFSRQGVLTAVGPR